MEGMEKECSDYEYFMKNGFSECKKCFSEKRELPFCGENCYVWIEANEDPVKAMKLLERFISDEDFRKEVFERNYTEEYI